MKPIIIANWKMNIGFRDSIKLSEELAAKMPADQLAHKDVVVCPSASSFLLVAERLKEHHFGLGFQDIFWEDKGAFTGCESPRFIYEAGGRYAIIGHSERREHLGESNDMVHKKIKAALENKITPVLCVGETHQERHDGKTDQVILSQMIKALSGIDLIPSEEIVIAYEPIWVIGSGRPIETGEAEHAFRIIYQAVLDLWPLTIVQNNVRIIYGGSVDGSSVKPFVELEHFGGFLVGGASLRADEFVSIVKQTII